VVFIGLTGFGKITPFCVPDINYNIVALAACRAGQEFGYLYAVLKADGTVEGYGRIGSGKSGKLFESIGHTDVVAIYPCCGPDAHIDPFPEGGCCLLKADGTVEKVGNLHRPTCTPPPADSNLWGHRVDLKEPKPEEPQEPGDIPPIT
jgi:hypothetical protein